MLNRFFNPGMLLKASVALSLMALLQGCDWFKPRPDLVAEVGDSKLYLSDLRAAQLPGDTLTREQWVERIEHWVNREILYREARARHVHKDPQVQRLLEIAERKILVDHLRMRMDSEIGDISDGDMIRFYEAHPDLFRRDRDVWTVAVVQFPACMRPPLI